MCGSVGQAVSNLKKKLFTVSLLERLLLVSVAQFHNLLLLLRVHEVLLCVFCVPQFLQPALLILELLVPVCPVLLRHRLVLHHVRSVRLNQSLLSLLHLVVFSGVLDFLRDNRSLHALALKDLSTSVHLLLVFSL